jgi:hypothetical protein
LLVQSSNYDGTLSIVVGKKTTTRLGVPAAEKIWVEKAQ